MKDYKKEALEYIDRYIDIVDDFANGDYETIEDLMEYLTGGAVGIEIPDGLTDKEEDAEVDRYLQELHAAIEEHAEEIKKGLLIRQILDICYNDKIIMELFNNNIWNIYGELNEIFDNIEDLEQINKNLGGKEVETIC